MNQANTYSEIIGNQICRKITAFFAQVKLRQSDENLADKDKYDIYDKKEGTVVANSSNQTMRL